ncbi:MAG: hypothetical protein K2L74_03565 [Muribaculaceae bacterium]|nr:hypothetical protein [Muribaculaceae bacterium]
MASFLKYLFQLMLSPQRGWEDLSHDGPDPEELLRRGYYPLAGIGAASEFVQMLYRSGIGLASALQQAIATFCAFFAAVFLSRMLLDELLPKVVDGTPSDRRTATLNLMCLGQMLLIRILDNLLPTDLTLLHFLPIYVLLIYYKGSRYMAVRSDSEMNYMVVGLVTVVAVPVVLGWLLGLVLG